MKKFDEDKRGCFSCLNYNNADICDSCGASYSIRYEKVDRYANKEQCEHLLKLWDDANGSIAEWRENDRPMREWLEHADCWNCYGRGICEEWSKSCGGNGNCLVFSLDRVRAKYYANNEQTEALLKWHDDRYGKIGDGSMGVQEKLDSLRVYGEKEDAVEDLDFRVGDKVEQVTVRHGEVVEITHRDAVKVQFKDGSSQAFSKAGGPTIIDRKAMDVFTF